MEKFKEAIYRRFPEEIIKQRPGKGGRTLDYIPTPFIIDRLNEIFNFNWSFQVFNVEILITEVYVTGKLSGPVNGIIEFKEQFGCKDRIKGNSLGDTLKSAASDALKKCATLFGIASHLYKKDVKLTRNYEKPPVVTPNANSQDKPQNTPLTTYGASSASHVEKVITEKQRKRMFAISFSLFKGDSEAKSKAKNYIDEILRKNGYESSLEVKVSDYDKICAELETSKFSFVKYIPTESAEDNAIEEFCGEEPQF